MQKTVNNSRFLRLVAYVFNFSNPLYIYGMDEVRDFEFCARIDHRACKLINTKVGEKGVGVRTCTYYNFGTALYL